jgi:hypothetical protein
VAHDPERRADDYRKARIYTAAAFTSILLVLLVTDALSPEYAISPVVLGTLVAGILTLLGIEFANTITGADRLIPRRRPPEDRE